MQPKNLRFRCLPNVLPSLNLWLNQLKFLVIKYINFKNLQMLTELPSSRVFYTSLSYRASHLQRFAINQNICILSLNLKIFLNLIIGSLFIRLLSYKDLVQSLKGWNNHDLENTNCVNVILICVYEFKMNFII